MFRKFSPMRAERITAVLSRLTPPPLFALVALALLAAGATFLMYTPSAHALRTVTVTRDTNDEVAEGGSYPINFSLDCPSTDTTTTGTVTVRVDRNQPGTYEPGDWDWVGNSNSLPLDCGGLTSGAITVHTHQDNDADNEGVNLELRATPTSDIRLSPVTPAFTLTIVDDDTAVTLNVPRPMDEGGTTSVTATLNSADTQNDTTVTVSAAPVSPTVASDFSVSADNTITITAGDTTSTDTVIISANEDNDDDDETVTVSGSVTAGGAFAPKSVTLNILDNDTPGVLLSVSPNPVTEGGTATVTARVNGQAEETFVTVSASPAGTGGTVTGDFTLSGQRRLRIPAGINQSNVIDARNPSVTITANQDGDTNDETVTVSATATGGVTRPVAPVTLNITDDDKVSLSLSASPNPVPEGETSTVTGTLTGNRQSATTVTVAAAAGTAEPGDFSQPASTFTIPAGTEESTGTVAISTVKDTDSDDETVTISAVTNNSEVPTPDSITLTISDLDKVILSANPNPVTEGATATITARIPGNEPAPTTVTVSAVAGTAEPDDFSLSANRTLTIAAGANQHSTGEVTVTTFQDPDAEDETVTISATAAGAITATPEDVTLTVRDDDASSTPGGGGNSGSGGGGGGIWGCAVAGSGDGGSGALPAAAALLLAVSFRKRLFGNR